MPHINFLENKPNVAGRGPTWLFDLDYLTDSMNYHSVRSENQANQNAGQQESNQKAGTKDKIDAGDSEKEDESNQDCFELPIWHSYSSTNSSASKSDKKGGGPREEEHIFLDDLARLQRQEKEANEEAEALRKNLEQETENMVTQAGAAKSSSTNIFSTVSTTAKASGTNLVNTVSIPVSTALILLMVSLLHSSYDVRCEAGLHNMETVVNVSNIQSSELRFKKVSDSNRFSLMGKSYRQEEGIDYNEVFAPVARLEAIRIFLAFASYMGFIVYQIDVKSVFLYGKIDEEVYVSQPPGFLDSKCPEKVYKVVKALYGLHQAPRACYNTIEIKKPLDNDEEASDSVLVLGKPKSEAVVSESRHLTWNSYSIVIMLVQILTGNPQRRLSISWQRLITWNAKSKPYVATSTTKKTNMMLPATVAVRQSKNTLVKHFEDMRLCRPFQRCKIEVMLVNPLRRFRESQRRATDDAEAFLILTLFIICLDQLVPDLTMLVPWASFVPLRGHLEKKFRKGMRMSWTLKMSRSLFSFMSTEVSAMDYLIATKSQRSASQESKGAHESVSNKGRMKAKGKLEVHRRSSV
ncbi:putative ribonuclease H-like domain-containing protein [Tanacetum coccineum]|uniref:Ribonuclease H-like domain-containing protein n=1 Tax=Tanacetum coccineum TaxID=301880 RepID=A0ABQ5GDS8_9ASTR